MHDQTKKAMSQASSMFLLWLTTSEHHLVEQAMKRAYADLDDDLSCLDDGDVCVALRERVVVFLRDIVMHILNDLDQFNDDLNDPPRTAAEFQRRLVSCGLRRIDLCAVAEQLLADRGKWTLSGAVPA